ncbi:hypothetical protein YB2330_000768 [Saitoella coloradoensis]
MGINNPIPLSMSSECKKVGKILASFVDPKQTYGPNAVIPPSVLQNAKGLAVITVIKAGFLFSGRVGSGLVVARLPDGSWSAPSAIATAGMGFGGQVGAEITDFVFILNNRAAVDSFSQLGSITLGGNISVAAGPVGRSAEAAGSANFKAVAAIFSYSKTKGLFAGVSLEGSVLIERRDANKKFYGGHVTAKRLLNGTVPPPESATSLYRVLNSRAFSGGYATGTDEDMYNDIPIYGEEDDEIWGAGVRGEGYGEGRPSPRSRAGSGASFGGRGSSYRGRDDDDLYGPSSPTSPGRFKSSYADAPSRSASGPAPSRPTSSKPDFSTPPTPSPVPSYTPAPEAFEPVSDYEQAVALFSFEGEQGGDLSFTKGDVIEIVKRTGTTDDWWTGRKAGREGIFPANYVRML